MVNPISSNFGLTQAQLANGVGLKSNTDTTKQILEDNVAVSEEEDIVAINLTSVKVEVDSSVDALVPGKGLDLTQAQLANGFGLKSNAETTSQLLEDNVAPEGENTGGVNVNLNLGGVPALGLPGSALDLTQTQLANGVGLKSNAETASRLIEDNVAPEDDNQTEPDITVNLRANPYAPYLQPDLLSQIDRFL